MNDILVGGKVRADGINVINLEKLRNYVWDYVRDEVFDMGVDLPAINSVMAIGDIDLVQPHMLSKPRVTRELFCVKDHIVSKDELISDNTPKIVEDETN